MSLSFWVMYFAGSLKMTLLLLSVAILAKISVWPPDVHPNWLPGPLGSAHRLLVSTLPESRVSLVIVSKAVSALVSKLERVCANDDACSQLVIKLAKVSDRILIMSIVTSNSTSVKPPSVCFIDLTMLLRLSYADNADVRTEDNRLWPAVVCISNRYINTFEAR